MYVKTLVVITLGIFVGVCEVDGTPFDYPGLLKEPERFEKRNDIKAAIIGGYKVYDGEIPYQVALRNVSNNEFLCGGSVLNSRWILTAAHCLVNEDYVLHESQIVVIAGSANLMKNGKRRNVSKIVVNSKYYEDIYGSKSDIALLKLTTSLPIDNHFIKAVTLPQKIYPAGTACIVSGWGMTKYTTHPMQLSALETYTTSFENCRDMYPGRVDSSNLCSKNVKSTGTCYGDSGGPLVVFDKETPVQIGVVSAGPTKGCVQGPLDIYVDVKKFIGFINENINSM